MSANRNITGPIQEGDEFDWRWVGEPESWMGLRSERSLTRRPAIALSKGEPQSGRLAGKLVQSLMALFRR